jgi:hypothetical protein
MLRAAVEIVAVNVVPVAKVPPIGANVAMLLVAS